MKERRRCTAPVGRGRQDKPGRSCELKGVHRVNCLFNRVAERVRVPEMGAADSRGEYASRNQVNPDSASIGIRRRAVLPTWMKPDKTAVLLKA
jgi:hypothetical protein